MSAPVHIRAHASWCAVALHTDWSEKKGNKDKNDYSPAVSDLTSSIWRRMAAALRSMNSNSSTARDLPSLHSLRCVYPHPTTQRPASRSSPRVAGPAVSRPVSFSLSRSAAPAPGSGLYCPNSRPPSPPGRCRFPLMDGSSHPGEFHSDSFRERSASVASSASRARLGPSRNRCQNRRTCEGHSLAGGVVSRIVFFPGDDSPE